MTTPEERSQDQQSKSRLATEIRQLDEELVLYDEEGPWKFLKERLESQLTAHWEALYRCEMSDVEQHRAVISVVRDLLLLPEALREKRAGLSEELESYG